MIKNFKRWKTIIQFIITVLTAPLKDLVLGRFAQN